MGRGRPNKPTGLKVLHGDFDKDPQRENKREPKPKAKPPKRPPGLDSTARAAWDRVSKLLVDMAVLTEADREPLEIYARTYSKWRTACKEVDRDGITCEHNTYDKDGNVVSTRTVRNPAEQVAKDSAATLIKLLTEFGLTPSSRTRIQIESETDSKADKEKRFLA